MMIQTFGLKIVAVTALLTVSHSAYALSCMRPDPVQQCKQMQQDKASPGWLNGQISLKKIISQENKPGSIGGKGPTVAEFLFTGTLSDQAGKRQVTDQTLRLSTSCAGPWCTALPKTNTSGNFLVKSDAKDGLSLHLGPCSFQPYTVTKAQAAEIEACVTPEPVKQPEVVKNKGGSQVYTQRSKKKLVE